MIGIWTVEYLHPQQIEFAKPNINFTVLSKRKLKQLVDEGHVDGWDIEILPQSGLRRKFILKFNSKFC